MSIEGPRFKRMEDEMTKPPAGTPPSPAPERVISMPEIRRVHSKELAAFLDSHPDPEMREVGKRWFEGTSTPADIAVKLPRMHQEFNERMNAAEKISNLLAVEILPLMKKHSPAFKAICDMAGDDKMARLLKNGIVESAYKDSVTFAELQARQARLDGIRKRFTDAETEIQKFCEKYQFTEDEYTTAMKKMDGAARRTALRTYVKEHGASWYERFRARKGTREMAANETKYRSLMADRDRIAQEAGNFLAALIPSNPDWTEAMNRALSDEQPEFKDSYETLASFDDVKNTTLTEDDSVHRAEEFKRENPRVNWSDPRVRDRMRERFYRKEEERLRQLSAKKGFWAVLGRALSALFTIRGNARLEAALA